MREKSYRISQNSFTTPGIFLHLGFASISAMEMLAKVPGKGSVVANLFKHLSPVTLTRIQREVPIIGRVNFYERGFAYILTNVVAGEEKSKKEFKKGQVAFMPSGSSICFFLQEIRSYKPMNLLGEVTQGMETLESLKRGDSIRDRKNILTGKLKLKAAH